MAEKLDRYDMQFRQTFKCPLRMYWHPLFGFDITGFDEHFIHTPANVSMWDYINEKYGKDAVTLIENLLHI